MHKKLPFKFTLLWEPISEYTLTKRQRREFSRKTEPMWAGTLEHSTIFFFLCLI